MQHYSGFKPMKLSTTLIVGRSYVWPFMSNLVKTNITSILKHWNVVGRHTHTVDKYYEKFEKTRHKVLVHNKHYDEAYFVTKFVNGLA
jgi:hypothetical protein